MFSAHHDVKDVKSAVATARNSNAEFAKLFQSMSDMTTMEKPRTASMQTLRVNHQLDDVQEYYRVGYYLEYCDHLITQLETRFASSSQLCAGGFLD